MSDKRDDYVSLMAQSFEQWISKQDCSWKEKYKRGGKMTDSVLSSSSLRVGSSADDNTQLPTPKPSPSLSPSTILRPLPPQKPLCRFWKLEQLSKSLYPISPPTSPKRSPCSATSSSDPNPPYPERQIFTTTLFEVRKSPKGGLGAFAARDIEEDTIIMAEEPLFKCTFVGVFYEFEKLSKEQRKEYLDLYAWTGIEKERILAIFSTNRFTITNAQCGIFLKSSRFNHACHPYATCTYRWDEEKNEMVTRSIMSIKKGEEITISYSRNPSMLHCNYGFWCDCPGCPSPTKAKAEAQNVTEDWIY